MKMNPDFALTPQWNAESDNDEKSPFENRSCRSNQISEGVSI